MSVSKCGSCGAEAGQCQHTRNIQLPTEVSEVAPHSPRPEVQEKPVVYVPGVRSATEAVPAAGKTVIREVYGPKGDKGDPGRNSTVAGPAGRDGKNPNVAEVVALARKEMTDELDQFRADLGGEIVRELKNAGFVDAHGKAIIIPGPAGKDGAPGQSIVGPSGKNGVGAPGRDGIDGKSANIAELVAIAKQEMQTELDLFRSTISRSIIQELKAAGVVDEAGQAVLIPGPQGPPGEGKEGLRGVQGKPGDISAAIANAEREARAVVQEELSKFRAEILELLAKAKS